MIHILHTNFQEQLSEEQYHAYLEILPSDLQNRAKRYFRWQDAHAFLLGKLLLIKGLEYFGLNGKSLLQQLQYTKHRRPYLPSNIDFNITHSGEYVACALSDHCKVGLDIEKMKTINLSSFKRQMTDEEWDTVVNSTDPQRAFLYYWTKKEAAIKAHGHGLTLPLKEVVIGKGEMILEEKSWPLYEINLSPDYICHLVTDQAFDYSKIQLESIYF